MVVRRISPRVEADGVAEGELPADGLVRDGDGGVGAAFREGGFGRVDARDRGREARSQNNGEE